MTPFVIQPANRKEHTVMSVEHTSQMPTADPGGPLGLDAHYGRLLGLLAARLLNQVTHSSGTPTLQIMLDLDAGTDPIDVHNALLQAAGAFGHNQQLRAYLGQLTAEHTLTLLTAAHMWQLLSSASAALSHHTDLSDADRELVRTLEQMRELAETPIASVPEIGVEPHEELQAAREIVAALNALEEATTSGDPHQVSPCQQLLAQAREEYRELVAGHVHAPIGP
jgi:hypothetical protein